MEHPILQFISQYGYFVAVPLMILEGPIITIIMGFLASFGLFDLPIVIFLSFISDIISDTGYYFFGYHGGPRVMKMFKIPQLYENGELRKLKAKLENHVGKIFFAAKIITGVAHSSFVLAGVTRIGYRKILPYSVPGGIIWSSGLGLLGFYFGSYSTSINRFLSFAGIAAFGLVIVFLLYKFWFGKFLMKKIGVWKYRVNSYLNGGVQNNISKRDSGKGGQIFSDPRS